MREKSQQCWGIFFCLQTLPDYINICSISWWVTLDMMWGGSIPPPCKVYIGAWINSSDEQDAIWAMSKGMDLVSIVDLSLIIFLLYSWLYLNSVHIDSDGWECIPVCIWGTWDLQQRNGTHIICSAKWESKDQALSILKLPLRVESDWCMLDLHNKEWYSHKCSWWMWEQRSGSHH